MKAQKWMTLVAISIIVIMVGAAAIPAARTTAQENITIKFYRFFGGCTDEYAGVTDLSQAVGECGSIQVLTNKFNAENEYGITVETENVDWWTYYDRLTATFAGGEPPDIAVMHAGRMPGYVSRGMLRPLNDDFAAAGIDVSDIVPTTLAAVSFNDKIYALPWDTHAILWHLNVDLFAQAGLVDDAGNPILPTSADELLAQAKQMKEATGVNYLAVAATNDPMMYRAFCIAIWQQGGDVLSEDLTKATLNTPEGLAAVELFKALFDAGYADPTLDYAGTGEAFLNGQAAVEINGTWVVDAYNAQAADPAVVLKNYKVSDYPDLFGTPATLSDHHTWVVPVQPNPDPAKYEASMKFLKYLFDNNFEWAKTGHLPVRVSVLESAELAALPHRSEFLTTANIAREVPPIEYQGAFQDITSEALQGIWLAGNAPDQALGDAEARINDLLENVRK
ncbi:MAG: extracellular solute-binding protein [Chloroflexi bacterium]|nr:extracellular solute-binding protein [Chloroflexota bacterium]